jgi:hypothetical protein
MLSYVLRCSRVPVRMGKVIRHAIRHHWNIGHHASHVVYHVGVAALGTMLVCVAVPLALLPPGAIAPPAAESPASPSPPIAQLPTDRGFIPPAFVPGLLFSPAHGEMPELSPPSGRLIMEIPPADILLPVVIPAIPLGLAVAEPSSILVFAVGVMVLLMLRRRKPAVPHETAVSLK